MWFTLALVAIAIVLFLQVQDLQGQVARMKYEHDQLMIGDSPSGSLTYPSPKAKKEDNTLVMVITALIVLAGTFFLLRKPVEEETLYANRFV